MSRGRELITAFSTAWAARDLDAVMRLMSADCEFRSSVGPGPGSHYVGRQAVEDAFRALLSVDVPPDISTSPLDILADDEFGVTRWTTQTWSPTEPPVMTAACDIFVFAGPTIRLKDTYRKVLGPPPC